MKKCVFRLFIVSLSVLFASQVYSTQLPSNITPQQLEQFKRLPPAQQKALAQSMGIDYNVIKNQLNKKTSAQEDEQIQQTYPRGTKFDQYGNPLDFDKTDEERLIEDSSPKPFGYDVFANAPQTFAPTLDIAVPSHYIVGPGDMIKIQIFGKENGEFEIQVSREGDVVLPQLGSFTVAGMSFGEMKKFLTNEIKNKVLGIDVVITLSDLRSMRIFVAGDAFKPGPYILSALSSITHAIFAAGGVNDIGSLRNIQLKRAGKLITTLDLYDLLITGDSSNDILLKSGDVVFITPVGERVTVDGEVRRPAIYELKGQETFDSVLKMAGGMLPSAYPSSTVVERFNQRNIRTIVNVDLSNKANFNHSVQGGDYIRVLKTSEQFDDSVTIIGAVARPGKYQWQENQRISDLFPNIHAYVLEDADLTYGIIVREKDISRNIEVLQFSLAKALVDKTSKDNVVLEAHDKLLIFSNKETIHDDSNPLDNLAYTQSELLEKEKELTKKQYEERMFWLEFGSEHEEKMFDELEQSTEWAKQSIEELTGGNIEEEIDPKELALFSRQKMLAPVISKLQGQAASGQPIALVEVVGAVKYPGIYPLAVGSNVTDMLTAAGGLLESAFLQKAEITRNDVTAEKARKISINVNLEEALSGNMEQNISLQSKDRLNVHLIPAWQENHIVELRGEFRFPGKYTIQRGETIGQLIQRVGGYTGFAYLQGSVFTRDKLKKLEQQNLIKVSESLRAEIASKSLALKDSQMIDYDQAKLLLADLTKVTPVGRLVIDLPKIEQDPNFDVLLEDGDVLFVPTKQNSINVIGQVQLATSHIYQKHLDAFDYVDLSGGAKQQADADRIYIIKANGSVEIPKNSSWFASNDESLLKPGDTVVVPLDSYFMDNMTLWATSTQIIYQAAVAIAAISGL